MSCYYCSAPHLPGYMVCNVHLPDREREKRKIQARIDNALLTPQERRVMAYQAAEWLKNKRACEKWAKVQDTKAETVRY